VPTTKKKNPKTKKKNKKFRTLILAVLGVDLEQAWRYVKKDVHARKKPLRTMTYTAAWDLYIIHNL
jgi:hypothetical protein